MKLYYYYEEGRGSGDGFVLDFDGINDTRAIEEGVSRATCNGSKNDWYSIDFAYVYLCEIPEELWKSCLENPDADFTDDEITLFNFIEEKWRVDYAAGVKSGWITENLSYYGFVDDESAVAVDLVLRDILTDGYLITEAGLDVDNPDDFEVVAYTTTEADAVQEAKKCSAEYFDFMPCIVWRAMFIKREADKCCDLGDEKAILQGSVEYIKEVSAND